MKKSTTFNKTITKTKSWFVAFSAILFAFLNSHAQTNPTAQAPPITENFDTTTFTTLPSNFAAWTVNSSPIGTQGNAESSTANGDATISAAIAPQTTGGCWGFATASNGRFYIQTSSNGTNGTNQLAGAINASGLGSITIAYDIEMVSANLRTIGVELQYRIGTSGSWTNVSGTVYSHTSNDRSNGNIDSYNVTLPSYADNNSVVQIRWVTWRGSQAGNSSGIAIDNISITALPFQSTYYFRSKQSGNWNDTTTWEASPDNSTWSNAANSPDYTANTITISIADSVSLTATDTIDQVVVNGILSYEDVVGSTPALYNGTGTDLIINGKFYDAGPNSITWLSGATWSLGSNAYLIRNRGTSSNNWRDNYEGGISNIPASSHWIVRKNSADNPTLTTIGGMYYPNLTIENHTGSSWITSSVSSFTGSSAVPIIKGNLDIGGNGSNTVSFLNSNTAVNYVNILGDLNLKSGSTLRNQGTGFQVEGDLNLNGTVDYGGTSAGFILVGNGNQNLSGNLTFANFELNKASTNATVTLQSPATITGGFSLVKGYLITSAANLLTFAHHASVGNAGGPNTNDSSFVKGPVRKIGNSAFTFPLGKGSNYQYIRISAPADSTDAYTAEYFNTGQTLGTASDPTYDYISTCEYFTLDRTTGTSNVSVTLAYDIYSCVANLFPDPRVVGWNGTTWKDLGMGSITTSPFGGGITSDGSLNQYGAITLGNNSNSIALPPDTAFIPSNFRYIKNNGQLIATNDSLRPDIKYYMDDAYPRAYFSDTAMSYVFAHVDTIVASTDTMVRVDVQYLDANSTYPVAQKADSSYTNYFLAHCPTGVVNVPQYQRLNYGNLYNRIDLIYAQNGSGLKYAFNVHPGGKPDAIKAKYTGADSVKVVSGKLSIYTLLGNLTYKAPNAFKVDSSGNQIAVACNWNVANGNEATFTFPSGFNVHLPLIIMVERESLASGPAAIDNIEWSTYYGGSGNDFLDDSKTDASGNLYVSGVSQNGLFPITPGVYQDINGGSTDAVALKFNAIGQRNWATYIGGSGTEGSGGIAVDGSGSVYVVGYSSSANFPVLNPGGSTYYQSTIASTSDAFICKLNPAGSAAPWRTFYGGNSHDVFNAIKIDASDNIFIVGQTRSSDFSTQTSGGAYTQTCISGGLGSDEDGIILKFNSSGVRQWATCYGGSAPGENIRDLDIDPSGNLFVTGKAATTGTGFPTLDLAGATDYYIGTLSGFSDAFIAKFSNLGVRSWATLYGGSSSEYGTSVVTNSTGEIFVGGGTTSTNLPTQANGGSYYQQFTGSGIDAFLMKFGSNLGKTWSTYYGGVGNEDIAGLTIDNNGVLFATGATTSTNMPFPTVNPTGAYTQAYTTGSNSYVIAFDNALINIWGTYVGGSKEDAGNTIVTDINSHLFVIGQTNSDASSTIVFPLDNGAGIPYFQGTWGGGASYQTDGSITRFDVSTSIFTGVNDIHTIENGLAIYPNPSSNVLNVNFINATNSLVKFSMYNVLGEIVQFVYLGKQSGTIFHTFDISHLTTGVYFVQVQAGNKTINKKFIKQ